VSSARKIEDAPMCFGCGRDNPVGLQLRFSLDASGRCTAVFAGTRNHVGYDNIIHGGIIFTALDDVMSNALYLRNRKAVTTTATVRYRQPLHVGQIVELFGWIESERMFLVDLKGEVRLQDGGDLIADSTATFMIV
jgi:acyl-coenzyme A thioesterase PaaI-like protein